MLYLDLLVPLIPAVPRLHNNSVDFAVLVMQRNRILNAFT